MGLNDKGWQLKYEIRKLVDAFRIWHVHRATHVFRLYDYNNYFLTTQELGPMYYTLPVKYREVLVWKYKRKIYVLANGDRLVPGGEYNGIFQRAHSKASSSDSPAEKMKKAYNTFGGLELGNIIRLKFFNRRIDAKGSIHRHDMRFIVSGTANRNKWELCKRLLINFRNKFLREPRPVTYDETRDGVVYRYVNGTLFAYKLVNVSGSDNPHAMALMMKSTLTECEMGTFNINRKDAEEYEADDNRTAAAGALHVHKTTGRGLCVAYTYLCAEIFLLCAELWKDRTGMQTSRVLMHKWLTESNITRAELDKFDKLAEVQFKSVIERRRNMKTEFDPGALRQNFVKNYEDLSIEFQAKFEKFKGTEAFLQRYTNPDRVPVKRARSPVSSPKRKNPGAELDDYENAPPLEYVPEDSLNLGGDELKPIEIIDVTEAANAADVSDVADVTEAANAAAARIIQGWYLRELESRERRKITTLDPDTHVPRNRDLLPTPKDLTRYRLSPLRNPPPLPVSGNREGNLRHIRRSGRKRLPRPVPPRAKVVLRF
jgi:hypothetical protein